MAILKRFLSGISMVYRRLTSVSEEERLNGYSLFLVIVLDILLLSALFTGLSDHSSQFTPPDKYFPQQYRRILLEQAWDIPSQQILSLQDIVIHNKYRYVEEDERRYTMHPACENVDAQLEKIKRDVALDKLFELRLKATEHQESLKHDVAKLNDVYNISLIEQIVDRETKTETGTITQKIKTKTRQIDQLEAEVQRLEDRIFANQNVTTFLSIVKALSDTDKKAITAEIRTLNFWYPVKLLFYQLIFLLPLLVATYLWSLRTLRLKSYVQTLIATHLMVIISIPILVRVIDIVTEIIPKKLLKEFLAILQKLHIIALWHYFLIFLLVVLGIYFIRYSQILAKRRAQDQPIVKIDGTCHTCANLLPSLTSQYCPYCGETQMLTCKSCDALRFAVAPYCHSCGAES